MNSSSQNQQMGRPTTPLEAITTRKAILQDDTATIPTNQELKNLNPSLKTPSTCGSTKPHQKNMLRPLLRSKKSGALPAMSSDASRIRSRYLHRLGLDRPSATCRRVGKNCSRQTSGPCCVEVLKNDFGSQDESLAVGSPPVHSPIEEHKRIVSFESSVVVHEIPSRNSYSERVRNTLWMQRAEYAAAVTKNIIEFLSEGNNPEKVFEEKDFIMHDGELVHPVYLMLGVPELLHKYETSLPL